MRSQASRLRLGCDASVLEVFLREEERCARGPSPWFIRRARVGARVRRHTITVAGSTALLPLVKDAADAYQRAHPDVKISVSGGGSGTGIAQVAQKAVDIGDSDIPAPGHPRADDNRVAVVGFAVVVESRHQGQEAHARSSSRTSSAVKVVELERGRRARSEDRRDQPPAQLRDARRLHEDDHGRHAGERFGAHRRRDGHRRQHREADAGRDLVRGVLGDAQLRVSTSSRSTASRRRDDNVVSGKYPVLVVRAHVHVRARRPESIAKFIASSAGIGDLLAEERLHHDPRHEGHREGPLSRPRSRRKIKAP